MVRQVLRGMVLSKTPAIDWLTFLWRKHRDAREVSLDDDLYMLYESELVPLTRIVEEESLRPEPFLLFKTWKVWKTGSPGYGVYFS